MTESTMDVLKIFVLTWLSGDFSGYIFDALASPEVKVRLVGGRSNFEGRVEVYYNNTWGTVCDDSFGNDDAGVFCYMLGYERHGAQARHQAHFGSGNKTIWLDDLDCKGTEVSVAQCDKHRGIWGSHNCKPTEDAGIICQPKVRLIGGSTEYEGLIEVDYSIAWGNICPDNFSTSEAQVLCSMLGHERYGAEVLPRNISFEFNNGSVWLGNTHCFGNETSISHCNYTILDPNNCSSNKGAAVKCIRKYGVRLMGGLVEYEGRVEINDGGWKSVCSDNFTNEDAQVLCYMLGYPREDAMAFGKAYFGQGANDTWDRDITCGGQELSIATCDNKVSGLSNCSHMSDVGIRCRPNVRLAGGKSEYDGRIEVYHAGIWGTVCDDSFGDMEAKVFCFMIGYYRNGSTHDIQQFNNGINTIWLDDLECTGEETSVDECPKKDNTWGSHNCGHSENAGIICTPKSECRVLATPNYGNYSDTSCTSAPSPVGTQCSLLCYDGFKPLSEDVTTCFGTGLWNVPDIFMTCLDVDECEDGTHSCAQNCRNTHGKYECSCNDGYILGKDNMTCDDIDECETNKGGCSHNCTNEIGSFVCTCLEGYALEDDGFSCLDVNECDTGNGGCNQICNNVEGSFRCSCNPGYHMMPDNFTTCVDDDECSISNGGCDQVCVNTDGNFSCSCYEGYFMNNVTEVCNDINECEVNNGLCDHNCHNSDGKFSCSCFQGYKLFDDNSTCLDINECMHENGGCEQDCNNENGSFSCSCHHGYVLQNNNISCVDVDECSTNNGGCHHVCINTEGAHECSCSPGFILQDDLISCKDTNECEVQNGGCEQICINHVGNFSCECETGYFLQNDSYSCADLDECDDSKIRNCEQLCINNQGSFSCGCRDGFSLEETNITCRDIIECDIDNGGCQQLCYNLYGSFACGCKSGYILNGNKMTCDNVIDRSQSSSLRITLGKADMNDLRNPVTYYLVKQQLGITLQKYFKNYTSIPLSIVVSQILKIDDTKNDGRNDIVIVNFTVVYNADTNSRTRENIVKGILNFNQTKLLQYDDNLVPATLVNDAPVISPPRMLVSLPENASIGTLVGMFTVQDADDDIRGEIQVYSNDKPNEIEIGQVINNKVQLVLKEHLDADKYQRTKGFTDDVGPVVNFTVVVMDRPGLRATADVSLTIIDINDNSPVCRPGRLTVKIPRDETVETEVSDLSMVCSDHDYSYNHVRFDLTGDTCNAFSVTSSGSLSLKSAIAEEHPSCTINIKVTDLDNNQFHTKLTVHIKFKECPPDVDNRNKAWKRGSPGKYTFYNCSEGYIGKVKRFCNLNAEYLDPIYNCTSAAIAEIMEKVLKKDADVSSVLTDLANVTAPSNNTNSSLMVGDLETVNNVISKITEVIEVNTDNVNSVADLIVQTANNILDESTTTSWTSVRNETGSGADSVLENLDRFAEKISNVSTSSGEIKVAKKNLFLKVGSANACNGSQMQFPDRGDKDVPDWAERTLDKIEISCSEKMASKSYSSVMYRNLSKILPSTVIGNSTKRDEKLNAPVMSFSYFPSIEGKLEKPIEITFQLYDSFLDRPLCSFWKKGSNAGWSEEGCWLVKFDKQTKTVVCKCNHLTNFAVLMSPASAKIDHVALSVISLTGCAFSMFCLLLNIVINVFFWRELKSEKTVINLNLACALFVAYLIFLAGVNQTENKGACTAVAVLLHLVYLVVFFIMLSEGLLLAKTVLYPLNTRKHVIPLLIGAYGLPVIIVAISAGSVTLEGYGDDKSCWLSTKSDLIWAFIAPALTVVLINTVIVVLVLRAMFETSFLSKKSRKEKAVAGARSIAVMMPIMGITWVLGVFSVNEDTVLFQYLFAIFNSTQGVLIFVFHCVLNKKIRNLFKKQKSKWVSLRSYNIEKSTSSSMKSTRVTDNTTSTM